MSSRYRILTVGDGDLSLSLALTRALGHEIDLTASTLIDSSEELLQTYPHAVENLHELEQQHDTVNVCYGVDATQLHRHQFVDSVTKFDMILFHHPHLGDYDETDEHVHLQRHYVLLAHYLASATALLKDRGRVHVCLRASQPSSWQLDRAVARAGLVECSTTAGLFLLSHKASPMPVQHPIHHMFVGNDWHVNDPPNGPRQRQSKTGSRHWLYKYGYRHQRTFPSSRRGQVDVSGSYHYFFEKQAEPPIESKREPLANKNFCAICEMQFLTVDELQAHLEAPSLPNLRDTKDKPTDQTPSDGSLKSHIIAEITEKPSGDTDTSQTGSSLPDDRHDTAVFLLQKSVAIAHDGKRLRWYLQHCITQPKRHYSKRESERLITGGKILVDGHVALDSSRILRAGSVVSITQSDPSSDLAGDSSLLVKVVDSWSQACHVVWKPVGMRTIGSFAESTLEQIFSKQYGNGGCSYKSLSKLDTGCSGLCLLVDESKKVGSFKSITHTYSVLVYGHVPLEWKDGVEINLAVDELRRWKKKRKESIESRSSCSAHIQLLEQTGKVEGTPLLSTLSISTDSDASGLANIISFYLRKTVGYPVVGDRFASSEYLALPRSIRNRIKQRLCMGCTTIAEPGIRQTEHAIPEKWCASYWAAHCKASVGKPAI